MLGRSPNYLYINAAIAVGIAALVLFTLWCWRRARYRRKVNAVILTMLKETPGLSAQRIRVRLNNQGLKVSHHAIYVVLEKLRMKKLVTRFSLRGGQERGFRDKVLYR